MRVLVTGVTGFLGRRLADHLLQQGDEVWGTFIGRQPSDERIVGREVDLRSAAGIARVVEESAPDAIVHLAALSHVGSSWQSMNDHFDVNFLGTARTLEAAGSRRVVFVSSAEVYGNVPAREQPIGEGRRPSPINPYALTKAAAEHLVMSAGGTVVRCFNCIGAGQSAQFALPAFARQLAAIARGENEPVLRVGNLEARRDFVHVADAVAGVALLAAAPEVRGTYNLASGEAPSIAAVLDRLCRIAGIEPRIEVEAARLRPIDIPLLCGDAGRLRGLGWRPQRDLDEALFELWREALAPESGADPSGS